MYVQNIYRRFQTYAQIEKTVEYVFIVECTDSQLHRLFSCELFNLGEEEH